MILKEMYRGIDNSPDTKLTKNIGPTDEIIPVDDVSVFPEGPNYAVIGTAEDAEVIKYSVKTGNSLSGCIRGLGATTAQAWNAKNLIARNFTKLDHDNLIDNIELLNENKVEIEEGKTLSSNDYSNADKMKVNNIPTNPKYTDTTYTSGNNITIDSTNKIKIDIQTVTSLTDTTDVGIWVVKS